MSIESKEGNAYYICPKGHYEEKMNNNLITKKISRENKITVISERAKAETITKAKCSKCGNDSAYTWIVQTRSGDEGPTIFYRCTKCNYTWRVYT